MPTAGVHPVPPSPAPPELEPELELEPDPDPELDPELEPLDGLTPLDEPPGDPDDPLEVAPELPDDEDDAAPEEPLPAEPSKSPPLDDPGTFPNPGPEGADVPHEAAKHPTNAHSAHRRRSMASTFHRAASVPG
jgi:D-alanyl-D-alanine carboxypeptidase/D-alanyl-D-alanine-endopeptidase (penicillin-binding protein 4)